MGNIEKISKLIFSRGDHGYTSHSSHISSERFLEENNGRRTPRLKRVICSVSSMRILDLKSYLVHNFVHTWPRISVRVSLEPSQRELQVDFRAHLTFRSRILLTRVQIERWWETLTSLKLKWQCTLAFQKRNNLSRLSSRLALCSAC